MHQYPKYESELAFNRKLMPLDASLWNNHPEYPLHVHDFFQIVIITEGTANMQIGDNILSISPGDIVILHNNEAHGYYNTEKLSVINITFDPSLLNTREFNQNDSTSYRRLFTYKLDNNHLAEFPRYLIPESSQFMKIKTIANAIQQALHPEGEERAPLPFERRNRIAPQKESLNPENYILALGHFYVLVGSLSCLESTSPSINQVKDAGIKKAIDYMSTNYDSELDIEHLSRIACMSKRNFYRTFLAVTSKNPRTYLREVRIAKASELLQTTDKTITETAFACGFEDSNYFTRQFKTITGLTPRDHRRLYKSSNQLTHRYKPTEI